MKNLFLELVNFTGSKGFILIIYLFIFLLNSCTSDFTISRDDKCIIVIPQKSSATEKFAAEELSRYLLQITNNEKISVENEDDKDKSAAAETHA